MSVVVLDDIVNGRKSPFMIEAALHPSPQALERCRAVSLVGRPFCLEVVNANLCGGVHRPARFREEGWNMAAFAVSLVVEDCLSTSRHRSVKTVLWGLRGYDGKLVEMQGRQLGGNKIGVVTDVPVLGFDSDRKLVLVVQPWVEERTLAPHL